MTPTEYLRLICVEFNGSVVLSELGTRELLLLCSQRLDGMVHTIAGLAIVTVEGWATCAGNR